MTDIGILKANSILSNELRERMTDATSNWKVRTEAIDQIQSIILERIITDPASVLNQSEVLLEFFTQLLGD